MIVFVRDANKLEKGTFYAEHKFETTSANSSPNGNLICSADVRGNVHIFNQAGQTIKLYENCFSGKVREVCWVFEIDSNLDL